MPIKRSPHTMRTNKGFTGRSTKLSISQFLRYLFDINESAPPDGIRLKDEDIIESVKSEFGTKPISVRKIADPNSNASLSAKRAHYNKSKPPLLSIRYDHHEHPCRNYNSSVSIDDLRHKAWRYGIIDPRLFTVDEIKSILLCREEDPESVAHFRLPTKELITEFPFGSLPFAKAEESIVRTRIDIDSMELV